MFNSVNLKLITPAPPAALLQILQRRPVGIEATSQQKWLKLIAISLQLPFIKNSLTTKI